MTLAVRFKDLKSSGELVAWNGTGGFELRFEPRREKAGLRTADAGSWDECEDKSMFERLELKPVTPPQVK